MPGIANHFYVGWLLSYLPASGLRRLLFEDGVLPSQLLRSTVTYRGVLNSDITVIFTFYKGQTQIDWEGHWYVVDDAITYRSSTYEGRAGLWRRCRRRQLSADEFLLSVRSKGNEDGWSKANPYFDKVAPRIKKYTSEIVEQIEKYRAENAAS